MNSIMVLLLLLVAVFLLLIFPVKKRRINFDEKGEAIKVYQEEAAHINRQFVKGFIDAAEKSQLLVELDKKSALAITAIEKKSFAYQRSLVPLLLIVVGLVLASALYYRYYQHSGVMRWQAFNHHFRGMITEGLFDERVVARFVTEKDAKAASAYCFAMQRELLAKYDTNPDALANLANCYILAGYPQLAEQAIARGLKSQAEHPDLNYLFAELQYVKENHLSNASIERLLTVIKSRPDHFKAIRLLAINSLNQGNYPQAKIFFGKLKQLAPEDEAQLLAALDRLLGAIDAKIAGQDGQDEHSKQVSKPLSPNYPPISQRHPPISPQHTPLDSSPDSPPDSPPDSLMQTAAAGQNNTATTPATMPIKDSADKADSPTVNVQVELSRDLAKTLSGDNMLFVIIKTPQGQLLNAGKYVFNTNNQPLLVSINDNSEGIMPMAPMSGHTLVSVVARISLTHSPIARSGDLTSVPVTITLPQDKVTPLLIDRKVP